MIRSLWLIIATVSIANLLALAGFFGWLAATDRMDMGRVRDARALFVDTRATQAAQDDRDGQLAEATAAEEAERAKEGAPPITADQRMRIIRDYVELINQRTERTRRETQDLINTLLAQQARLSAERAALEEDKRTFETMRAEIAEIEGSEQFAKTLKIYESVKPDAAVSMLRQLVDSDETDQVIEYLNAMKARTATAIISKFEDSDPVLAANLLEGLRVRGLVAQAPEAE